MVRCFQNVMRRSMSVVSTAPKPEISVWGLDRSVALLTASAGAPAAAGVDGAWFELNSWKAMTDGNREQWRNKVHGAAQPTTKVAARGPPCGGPRSAESRLGRAQLFAGARYGQRPGNGAVVVTQSVVMAPLVTRPSSASMTSSLSRRPLRKPELLPVW